MTGFWRGPGAGAAWGTIKLPPIGSVAIMLAWRRWSGSVAWMSLIKAAVCFLCSGAAMGLFRESLANGLLAGRSFLASS